jgi:hypothetical protein
MKIDFDPAMIAASPQPVMLINTEAALVHANPAAGPLMPVFLKGRKLWSTAIAGVKAGRTTLPCSLDLAATLPEAQSWKVWLCRADDGYALIFETLLPDHPAGAMPGEFALIGKPLRDQISAFAESVRRIDGSLLNRHDIEHRGEMLGRAGWIVEVLDELTRLSELHAGNPLKDEERVFLYPLVQAVAADLRRPDGRAGPWDIDPAGAGVAPLYGRRDWLTLAVRACMKRLLASCPDNARLRIELRQVGDFALLTGGVGPRAGRPPDGDPRPRAAAGALPQFDLDLQVAERVFELHGGQVRIRRLDSNDPLESFSVALPTAHPHAARSVGRCEVCPVARQAMEYARELASLL